MRMNRFFGSEVREQRWASRITGIGREFALAPAATSRIPKACKEDNAMPTGVSLAYAVVY